MTARETHLLDWLADGYTHCQHGTKDWCESYLKNAAEVIAAQDAHIASLEAERDEARRQRDEIGRAWDSADARAKEAESERDALRAALAPFAKEAAYFAGIPGVVTTHDNVELWQQGNYRCPITVGDLRRAARALSGKGDKP